MSERRLSVPNMILISGTGQNVGKTMLACLLIRKFSKAINVLGIKISPHFHKLDIGMIPISSTENCVISKESHKDTTKDSSRMLNSGASEVWYVQAIDNGLGKLVQTIQQKCDDNSLIICESGGLRQYVDPGIFFIVNREGNIVIKEGVEKYGSLADYWVTFDGESYDFDINRIEFSNHGLSFLANR